MATHVKEGIISELHKPVRIHYRRRHYNLKGLHDLWEIDLMDMKNLKKHNRGYQYILIAINAFSKFLYGALLKNKKGIEVARGLKKILNKGVLPKNIQSDMGSEFYNKHFKKLMKTYYITHYSTYSKIKCAHAERVIRTLRDLIFQNLHLKGTYNYSESLQTIINEYNNRKHRTIGMAPAEVNSSNEALLLNTYKNLKPFDSIKKHKKEKFKIGDYVRISKQRNTFDKSYLPGWSAELFKIKEIKTTKPITYKLDDLAGNPISGCFYQEEINRTKYKNEYLVEKVVKKRGNKLLIKWWGFQKPSWINQSAIL